MNKTQRLTPNDLKIAALLLQEGNLVAFPTETVYGLGACIFNAEAIKTIFKVKGRPSDNPLIAHVSSLDQIESIAQNIPPLFYLLAQHFFPGPLTVVLQRQQSVPSIVSAGLNSIAVRMPSHRVANQLISLVKEPLVAPSANLSGRPSSTHSDHVLNDLEGKISAVIEGGQTDIGIESTVVSLLGPTPILLRPGAITKEQIEKVLGCVIEIATNQDHGPVLSPGMKYRHYAPKAQIQVFLLKEELLRYVAQSSKCVKRMILSQQSIPQLEHHPLTAHDLYSSLRKSDQMDYEEILILCSLEEQQNTALMNRILRAAGSCGI